MWRNAGAALVVAAGIACHGGTVVCAAGLRVSHRQERRRLGDLSLHGPDRRGETLTPGADFVTVYNFAGMVGGSAKAPAGWNVSSEEFGKTPMLHGYPMVNPVDIPALSNVTWSPAKAIGGGAKVEGFTVTTSVSATTEGEYSAAVTRSAGGKASKQPSSARSRRRLSGLTREPQTRKRARPSKAGRARSRGKPATSWESYRHYRNSIWNFNGRLP